MSDSLIRLLPPLKRARDFYLYDQKGNRYLDLYLDGGRALCGHRPNGLSNTLKNTISRGLFASYPSVYNNRLERILSQSFPEYSFRGIYRSLESFQTVYGQNIRFDDPAIRDEIGEAVLWRPYLPVPGGSSMIAVQFPYPGVDSLAVLSKNELPPSDLISPVIEAGLVRSWFDLKNKMKDEEQSVWSTLDETGHWLRKGPYLKPICSEEEYMDLFRLYLKNKILISPYYGKPSILAVHVKEGVLKGILSTSEEVISD